MSDTGVYSSKRNGFGPAISDRLRRRVAARANDAVTAYASRDARWSATGAAGDVLVIDVTATRQWKGDHALQTTATRGTCQTQTPRRVASGDAG
ncbi:hypothetical protein, partial [Pseudonocardia sp. KRD291]|uniref:hypothetical protein n=1 Tax=Pseudonocardia sp. KRD291 TaxID=2792007 RepID=UPI001C49D43B